mmetsp:Transcript_5293/g.11835  ORF Transcript_5293/g.11835 Transcript_5293/m.11835 type:complete len:107 (-) Transcript_5293:5189-5509(-)
MQSLLHLALLPFVCLKHLAAERLEALKLASLRMLWRDLLLSTFYVLKVPMLPVDAYGKLHIQDDEVFVKRTHAIHPQIRSCCVHRFPELRFLLLRFSRPSIWSSCA